ncbi:MAG: TetR family transcriptional regulator [Solirubrobacterales bacterium]|nr:TetR family transcriptional regulator [Solirubrobacterales bacterium]
MAHDEELLEDPFSDDRIHRVFVAELGEELADSLRRVRRFQEAAEVRRHPEEGLRERKRRLTRQRISDVATILFGARGFDNVKVSQVAEIVGVSEKTVYNYFPTKESMVLDWADATVESLAQVIRECPPSESLTAAVVRAIKEDMERFQEIPDDLVGFLPRFMELIESTPALRAAWLEIYDRIVTVATEALAARAEVDPRDPEPMIAAQALSGLGAVALAARVRYIEQGLRGAKLRDAVLGELERAARLLDTGLWSFNLLTHGRRTKQQVLEAAKAAEEARAQVLKALRQARAAWREVRDLRDQGRAGSR